MPKVTTDECLVLDIVDLARDKGLCDGASGSVWWTGAGRECASVAWEVKHQSLYLSYEVRGGSGPQPDSYPVHLVSTPTRFSGERLWFSCPGCKRRVRKLYLPPYETYFLCRACHELTYRSQKKSTPQFDRAWSRLEKLREHLDQPSMTSREWRRTYEKARELRALFAQCHGAPDIRTRIPVPELEMGTDLEEKLTQEPDHAKPPRGRPKKKRSYVRKAPFPNKERADDGQALCMRCRGWRELKDPTPVVLSNGRPALRGTCPVCGAGMCQIMKGS